MSDTPAQIYDTLDRALAKRDSVGVLRTALTWWDALDDQPSLLRASAEALVARGRDERASQLIRHAARAGEAAGDVLQLTDAALRLDALREDSESLWTMVAALLEREPVRAARVPTIGVASPGTNISHDLDELVDLLVSLTKRTPEQTGRLSVPLIDDLGPDALDLLRNARPRSVPSGAPLLGPDDAVAWVLSGGVVDGEEDRPARAGTLLLAARAEERRRAAFPTRLLTIPEPAFRPWRDDERVVRFLSRSLRRAHVVEALSVCGWYSALSDGGRDRLLRAASPVLCTSGPIIEAGSKPAGLFILVRGRAEVVDRDERVLVKLGSVEPGDVVGEGALLTGEPSDFEVRVKSPAAFLLIPQAEAHALVDEEPLARDWLTELAAHRRDEIDRLDTGEVILLDD